MWTPSRAATIAVLLLVAFYASTIQLTGPAEDMRRMLAGLNQEHVDRGHARKLQTACDVSGDYTFNGYDGFSIDQTGSAFHINWPGVDTGFDGTVGSDCTGTVDLGGREIGIDASLGTEFVFGNGIKFLKVTDAPTPTPTVDATPEQDPADATPQPPAATPQPTSAATPTPTQALTPTPTAAATPLPTNLVTPTPTTPPATPAPTEAVTPTPTAAATPTPTTPAATPAPTLAATPTPTAAATPTPTAPLATPQPTTRPIPINIVETTPTPTLRGRECYIQSKHQLERSRNSVCMDAEERRMTMQICDRDNQNQHWVYTKRLKRIRVYDGKCLEMVKADSGANVITEDCDESKVTQKWYFHKGSIRGGTASTRALCIEAMKRTADGKIKMKPCHGYKKGQRWRLISAEGDGRRLDDAED